LLKHKELAEDCHFSWLFALSPSPHFLQLYFETTSHLGLQHLFLVDCKLFISYFHLLWVCLCLKTAAHFNCCYLSKNWKAIFIILKSNGSSWAGSQIKSGLHISTQLCSGKLYPSMDS